MKAKIRKTGEIVDVIYYSGSPKSRSSVLDYVNYIDSQGVEHTEPNHLNYYWDFEPIETTNNDEYWQEVRERAAIAAMQGTITILGSSDRSAFREVVVEEYSGKEKTFPKEPKKIEQKPTWNEEDEHRIKDTIYFLDTAKKHYASTIELDACIDWIKSIKQRIKE